MEPPVLRVVLDKGKIARIERATAGLRGGLSRIMVRALRRTASGARTDFSRLIRTQINAKARDVKKRIYDEVKATQSRWLWRIGLSNRRLAVSAFKARGSKTKGVSYSITKGNVKRLPRAFVAKMRYADPDRGTYKAIFRRAQLGDKAFAAGKGKLTKAGTRVQRTPLVFLRGPSIGEHVENMPHLLARVQKRGLHRLNREVDSQVKYEIAKRWPK